MMAELSSNWKKLQAKLKKEAGTQAPAKRKAENAVQPEKKRLKPSVQPAVRKAPSAKDGQSLRKSQMGGVQSSTAGNNATSHGVSPSLALWAADHDVSAEALAEAYSLGIKDNSMILASEKDRVNHGLSEGLDIGKYIAIDCEMVGVGPGGYESALARMSVVDFHGKQVYDSYVKPKENVTDWRTHVSGISIKEMRFARSFQEVQEIAAKILENRVLIGHDVKHDLEALKLSHPPKDIRDTAKHDTFKKHGNGRKPALRVLARQLLGVEIQSGAHSSIEDARVTMLLFRKHKSGFDVNHANRYATRSAPVHGVPKGKKSKKGKT